MIVSLFANEFDPIPKPVELTWKELCQALTVHDYTYTSKRGLPCWSPAEFKTNSRTKALAGVLRIHALVLDLDKLTSTHVDALDSYLQDYNALLYTTWSHHASHPLYRLRAVIAISRPIEIHEWSTFWRRATARIPVPIDQVCKDPTRIYFGPFSPPGTEHLSGAKVYADN